MSLPIEYILSEIEAAPGAIVPILSTLYHDNSIIDSGSKAQLKHLTSRTVNLAKSQDLYEKWCGTLLIKVLSTKPSILATDGSIFFATLLKTLEGYNENIDIKILNSTIDSIKTLCFEIKGKPTLTREILTPKLPLLIQALLDKLSFSPVIIIDFLTKLISNHTTTFRPFGNKFNRKLVDLLSNVEYQNFPSVLKSRIGVAYATLPQIEKSEPDQHWHNVLIGLIKETTNVLRIYQEFLNLEDDKDIMSLFRALSFEKRDIPETFAPLSVDINEKSTILSISSRIECLLDLIRSFLTTATPFPVRIPLGSVVLLNELICAINLKFVSFKRDIRDSSIKELIKVTLVSNQTGTIRLLSDLVTIYRGDLLPHLTSIIQTLETLIPFKGNRIDYDECVKNENLSVNLLSCCQQYLSLVKNFSDPSMIVRFIDVALLLIEPRGNNIITQPKEGDQKKQNNNGSKKKNKSAVPLSDLLSHQHLFALDIPSTTISGVRSFVNTVITRFVLPPTQQTKVIKYLLIESNHLKKIRLNEDIPSELTELLHSAVLFPGYERTSILPLASSILGDDSILSVFNNPRFPPLPSFRVKSNVEESNDMMDEEEIDEDVEVPEEPVSKKRKLSDVEEVAATLEVSTIEIPVEDSDLIFKKQEGQAITFAPAEIVEDIVPLIEEQSIVEQVSAPQNIPVHEPRETTSTIQTNDDEDSDFEMPTIDVDGSDESDEE